MYVITSEINWGYDGGSSTSVHAVVPDFDTAMELTNDLNSSEHESGEAKPLFEFQEIPDGKVCNLYHTNAYDMETRAEEIFDLLILMWAANARSRYAWESKSKPQFSYKEECEKFDAIPDAHKLDIVFRHIIFTTAVGKAIGKNLLENLFDKNKQKIIEMMGKL